MEWAGNLAVETKREGETEKEREGERWTWRITVAKGSGHYTTDTAKQWEDISACLRAVKARTNWKECGSLLTSWFMQNSLQRYSCIDSPRRATIPPPLYSACSTPACITDYTANIVVMDAATAAAAVGGRPSEARPWGGRSSRLNEFSSSVVRSLFGAKGELCSANWTPTSSRHKRTQHTT